MRIVSAAFKAAIVVGAVFIALAFLACLVALPAHAAALTSWPDWLAAQPTIARSLQPSAIVAKGIGENVYYVLEVDSATGTLAVNATFNVTDDHNYGTVGVNTPRSAAQIGNATGAADFGTGAAGAQTLRTVISSRSESVATPLAAQLSNGSAAVDYGSGASGTATLRTVLATRHEAVGTPLAVQLSNGSAAVAYDTGASSSATPRVVLATRHEAAATPVSVRLSDGTNFSVPAPAGRAYADSVRNAYASTGVTSGAWVQLIASTAAVTNSLLLFDSSGQTLELGTGAAASETRKLIIPPGGFDTVIPLTIPASTRVSIRAISGTASTGEIDITLFQ